MAAILPLTGVTVVSLEQAVAAPFATRQLADLGARVIKVERDRKSTRLNSSHSDLSRMPSAA